MKKQKMKKSALLACYLTIVLFSSSAEALNLRQCPNKGVRKTIPKILHTVWLGGPMPNLPKPTGPGDRKAKNYVDRVIISNNVLTGWRTYVWYDPRLLDEAGNPEMAAHFAGAARVELKSIIEFESNSLFKKLYKELVLDIATMNTLENRNKEMVTWAYWADIIRYAALTKYGGIYCDPKTKIIKKLGTAESNFKVLTGHCDDVILKTPIGSPATTGLGKKEFINNDYLGCIKNSKIMKAVFEGALTKTNNMIAFKNGRTQLIYPTFGHRGKYTYRNTGPQHLTMTYLEAKSFPQNPFTLKEFLKTFAAFSQYRRMSEDVWSAMDDKKLSIDKSLTPSIFEKSESDKFTVPGGYKVSWGGKREAYPIHAQAVNILQTSQIKAIKSHIVSAKNEASSSNSSKRFVTSLHDAIINATKMKRFREVGENMYEETGAFSAEILFEIEQRVKEYKAEPEYNALNPRIKALIDTIEEELDPENHVDAYIKNYITVNKLCKKKTDGQLTNTRSTFNPKNEAHKRRHPNLENPDVLPAEIITGLEKYCEDDRKRDN